MIAIENHLGKIIVSKKYIENLVKHTVSECFGVAGVCEASPLRTLASALSCGCLCSQHDGVKIVCGKNSDSISVYLHIRVAYGMNVKAVVESITHKVSFCIDEALGIKNVNVEVCVDGIN